MRRFFPLIALIGGAVGTSSCGNWRWVSTKPDPAELVGAWEVHPDSYAEVRARFRIDPAQTLLVLRGDGTCTAECLPYVDLDNRPLLIADDGRWGLQDQGARWGVSIHVPDGGADYGLAREGQDLRIAGSYDDPGAAAFKLRKMIPGPGVTSKNRQ